MYDNLVVLWSLLQKTSRAQHQADWGRTEDRLGLNPKLLLLSPGFPGSLGEGVVWTGLLGENRFGRRLRKGVREGGPLGLSCDHTGSMQATSAEYQSGPSSVSEGCGTASHLSHANRQRVFGCSLPPSSGSSPTLCPGWWTRSIKKPVSSCPQNWEDLVAKLPS